MSGLPTWSIPVEHPAIRVTLSSPPQDEDGYDGGFVDAEVHIEVGGFVGDVGLTITVGDMLRFHSELVVLDRDLKGRAQLRAIEEQISLDVDVDHRGHVRVSGYLKDDPSFGNRLTFEIHFDQTYLAPIVKDLHRALEELAAGPGRR